jgi:cytosine/adenosine deaminase-related metal-dependent hydrolase
MDSLYICNGHFCTLSNDAVTPKFGDAAIVDGRIVDFREKEFSPDNLRKTVPFDDPRIYDAGGRLITAPLVNFHDHIYSRLAKGQPLSGDFTTFENILKNLWWKLDCFLDPDMIRASASLTALESIRNGVTYIVDHHSSQVFAQGSLPAIKNTLSIFGIRQILCFETTDRNGKMMTKAGLEENISFAREQVSDDTKAMLGLHASFTLDDDTLLEARKAIDELGLGVHIHVCEDKADRTVSKEKYGASPVKRLIQHGLLNEKCILAHGLFVSKQEFGAITKYGSALALNVDSNMNNAVGVPPFNVIPQSLPILVGTDGMNANLARAFKQVFLAARLSGISTPDAFGLMMKIYFDQYRFIKKYFPDFTDLTVGSRADLTIWDYVPPTPLSRDNFWGHYLFGLVESPARSVMQNGNFLLRDFTLTRNDVGIINCEIHKQGSRLMEKFIESNRNTP